MARLPNPGGDPFDWGDILNDFLLIEHNADGTLRASGSLASKYTLPAGGIPKSDLSASVQAALSQINGLAMTADDLADLGDVSIVSPADGQVLAFSAAQQTWQNAAVPAAQVTSVAGKTGAVSLLPGDVGLGNVTNDAQVALSAIDVDGMLAANSDARISSQKAVKTYVSASIAAIAPADATATTPGLVQLAGDLAGGTDATNPTIAAGAVTGAKIASGTITANNLAVNAITLNNLADGAVTSTKLAAGAVTSSAIAAGAVSDANVAANAAISKSKLAGLAIVDADVSAISESKITNLTSDLAAKAPSTRQISAGTGLAGGGDLTADRSLSVTFGTAAGTAAQGNDSRITGALQSSVVTAKGDVLAGTAANAVTRVGVGGDGQVLTADSTQTSGVKWAAASSAPTGAASGDLSGNYPSPTVTNTHLSAPLPIAQGGTGASTQNFVDLSSSQTIGGTKTFTSSVVSTVASGAAGLTLNTTTGLATDSVYLTVGNSRGRFGYNNGTVVLDDDGSATPLKLTSNGNSLTFDTSGNTTLPGTLTVTNSTTSNAFTVTNTANDAVFAIKTTGTSKAAYASLYSTNASYCSFRGYVNGSLVWSAGRNGITGAGFGIYTGNGTTLGLIVDDSQRVGIGGATPTSALTLGGTSPTISTTSNNNLVLAPNGTGAISIADAANITLGTTTGTSIGTAASQKLGFYGKTPAVQQTGGAASAGTSYTSNEQTMLQTVYSALRTYGLLS